MSARWASIVAYRDFYDIPHAMVVRWRRESYFLDGPFDHELDDYPSVFAVYRFPPELPDLAGSWEGLATKGQFLGEIAAEELVFDPTRRERVEGAVLDSLVRKPDGA
jgi:hypothetical protein